MKSSLSNDGFLRSGFTMASLRAVGIFFSARDLLTVLWIIGSRVGSRFLTRELGLGPAHRMQSCILDYS